MFPEEEFIRRIYDIREDVNKAAEDFGLPVAHVIWCVGTYPTLTDPWKNGTPGHEEF